MNIATRTLRKAASAVQDFGEAAMDQADKAADGAEEVADSRTFESIARVGYAANGLIHIVIGFIAISIAAGASGEADQAGAVAALATAPGGFILLWVSFLGCLALILFQLSETAFGWKRREWREKWLKRAKALGKAAAYAVVGFSFGVYALGGETDSGETVREFSSAMMSHPVGSALLILTGVGVIGIGGYYVFKGATRRYCKDLEKQPQGPWGAVVHVLGFAGYISKGVALAVLGLLFIVATATAAPETSTGLDGALKSLQQQPFGALILTGIALGLICYGLYSVVRAPLDKM